MTTNDETPDPFYASLMGHGRGYDLPESVAELVAGLRPSWHQDAACRGVGPDVFFPTRGDSTAPAKALCAACLVVAECREAGQNEDHGIWAGESPQARRTIRSSGRLRPPASRPAA